MRILLFFLSCVPFLLGATLLADSFTGGLSAVVALSQAGTMFLIWAVLFAACAIVDAIIHSTSRIIKSQAKANIRSPVDVD